MQQPIIVGLIIWMSLTAHPFFCMSHNKMMALTEDSKSNETNPPPPSIVLRKSIRTNHIRIIGKLVRNPMYKNTIHEILGTLLMTAAKNTPSPRLVKLLLKHGANTTMRNNAEKTAFDVGAEINPRGYMKKYFSRLAEHQRTILKELDESFPTAPIDVHNVIASYLSNDGAIASKNRRT